MFSTKMQLSNAVTICTKRNHAEGLCTAELAYPWKQTTLDIRQTPDRALSRDNAAYLRQKARRATGYHTLNLLMLWKSRRQTQHGNIGKIDMTMPGC
eukprot:scaffold10069_cov52-Prasinocladus_malaysianus.AAC.2